MKTYTKIKIFIGEEPYNEYKLTELSKNFYEFNDDSCINKIELKHDSTILIRENEEFSLLIESTKEIALYKLKELNYELNIQINYFDILEEENNLVIAYQLETNDKEIKMILEGE